MAQGFETGGVANGQGVFYQYLAVHLQLIPGQMIASDHPFLFRFSGLRHRQTIATLFLRAKFWRLGNGRLLGGDGALRRPRTSQRDVRHLALTNFKPLK
jgi:hypothetical protein